MGISTRTFASRKVEDHLWTLKVLTSRGGKRRQGISPALQTAYTQIQLLWMNSCHARRWSSFSAPSIMFTSQLEMLLKSVHNFELPIANPGVLGPYAFLLSANLFVTSLHDWILALNWMVGITNSSCQFFKFTMHDGSSGKWMKTRWTSAVQ